MTVLPRYSKVSLGASSLDWRLHVLLIFIKTFHEMLVRSFLLYDKTISSFLQLIGQVLSISEHALEKQLLSILMENLHKALQK